MFPALRFPGSSCLRAVRPPTLRQHSGFRAVPAYEPSARLRYGCTPVFGQFLPTSRPTAYATAALRFLGSSCLRAVRPPTLRQHSGFWAVPAYEPSDRLRYGSTPVFGQFLPTSRPPAYATAALRFPGSSCLRAVRPPTLRQHSGFWAVPAYEPSDRLRYGCAGATSGPTASGRIKVKAVQSDKPHTPRSPGNPQAQDA
jgi:hypothetical protein